MLLIGLWIASRRIRELAGTMLDRVAGCEVVEHILPFEWRERLGRRRVAAQRVHDLAGVRAARLVGVKTTTTSIPCSTPL